MSRIRSIKPGFFKNEELAELPAMVRLLFIGLWTQADREGKLEDRPKRIKAEIFPYDNFDIEKGLNLLNDNGFILRYKVNANGSASILAPEQPDKQAAYIKINTFQNHQVINIKEAPSAIPEPAQYKHSANTVQASQEGKGKEGNMEGRGEEPPPIEIDLDLIKNVMTFFGFTQIKNADKERQISDFLKCLILQKKEEMFRAQFFDYCEYKKVNDSYKHSFKNFIGSPDRLYEDGAWNAENWNKKLIDFNQQKNAKSTITGSTAARQQSVADLRAAAQSILRQDQVGS